MVLLDHNNRFFLILNAKCGGTTLKHWFLSSPSFHKMLRSPRSSFPHFRYNVVSYEYWFARRMSSRYLKNPSDANARGLTSRYRKLLAKADLIPPASDIRKFLVVRNP